VVLSYEQTIDVVSPNIGRGFRLRQTDVAAAVETWVVEVHG
jgi:hypothetical protein